MKTLSIDIETYSDQNLMKTGVYRYVESPLFEILLFSYSIDGEPVQLVDLACGEKIPTEVIAALTDDSVIKWAFNANFERICLSRHLGYPTGDYLDPESWRCSMVWAATMGLPLSLEGVGAVSRFARNTVTLLQTVRDFKAWERQCADLPLLRWHGNQTAMEGSLTQPKLDRRDESGRPSKDLGKEKSQCLK